MLLKLVLMLFTFWDLFVKHGLYEDIYIHFLVKEVLEKVLEKFEKAIEGRVSRRTIFKMMLDYLDTLVTVLNKKLSLKIDYGVDNEKYSKQFLIDLAELKLQ